jgi:Uma2 family endonuclease
MAVSISRHRFTVDDYHRMAACGILGEDDRVELLDGEVVEMTPFGLRHLARVDWLNDWLTRALHGRAIVRVQGSVRLDPHSEPQPDLAILRYRSDFYAQVHAGPPDILFLIEVSDTSAGFDRDVKLRVYGRAGIAEVWLVNLPADRLEIYRTPQGDVYRDVTHLHRGDRIAPAAFPDLILPVTDILG